MESVKVSLGDFFSWDPCSYGMGRDGPRRLLPLWVLNRFPKQVDLHRWSREVITAQVEETKALWSSLAGSYMLILLLLSRASSTLFMSSSNRWIITATCLLYSAARVCPPSASSLKFAKVWGCCKYCGPHDGIKKRVLVE